MEPSIPPQLSFRVDRSGSRQGFRPAGRHAETLGEFRYPKIEMRWTTSIPKEIEEQYEGRWIAWDISERTVVGDGETMEEAVEAASRARMMGHLIWYRHILPQDSVIVGGL